MKSKRPFLSKVLLRFQNQKYYSTRDEAESKSYSGERILYEAGKGWYIIAPRYRRI